MPPEILVIAAAALGLAALAKLAVAKKRRRAAGASAAFTVVAAIGLSTTAHGFQISSQVTTECHERITIEALSRAGWPDGQTAPRPDDAESRIINDLAFSLPDDAQDPWMAALLIGARDNDVGTHAAHDVAALSMLHNDPARQSEHCLRRIEDDGAEADALALAACLDFILSELELALGTGDIVDLDATVEVETRLLFRGDVEIDVCRYAFHLGRALHALEDSYTHAFRNPDDRRVRHVLNWIEGNLGNSPDLERDGHPHVSGLDDCTTGIGAIREGWAADASADLIEALVIPASNRAERLSRAEQVILTHFEQEPGCTASNDWCGAPEAKLVGCSTSGRSAGWPMLLATAALLAFLGTRRALVPVAVASLALAAGLAHAEPGAGGEPVKTDEAAATEKDDAKTEKALDRDDKIMDAIPDRVTHPWGAAVSASGAFDRGAAAVSVGVRVVPWKTFGLGLDLEYNPWVSIANLEMAPGAVSLYVPLIWKLKRIGSWELRSTFYVGATMVLFDMVGVDRGSIGPFAGWNPLGLAIPIGADTKLVIKPGDIALPMPQIQGIPFYYHQYRFTVGLEWYP